MTAPVEVVCGTATLAAYGASAGLYLRGVVGRRPAALAGALSLLGAGWLSQSAGMAAFAAEHGRLPLGSIPEVLGLYAWLLVAAAVAVHARLGQAAYGAALAPLAAVASLLGQSGWRPRADLAPALASDWLPLHVLSSFLAYAVLTLAFAAAVLYLVGWRRLDRKSLAVLDTVIPPLAATERLAYRLVAVGVPLLGLAIVSGALWASAAWGSAWRWDPKETMALATWLLWGGCWVARHRGWRGRRAAWLVVAGFVATLVLFLGVGYLAPGRHDFGA